MPSGDAAVTPVHTLPTHLAASVTQSQLELAEALGSLECPWGSPHYYYPKRPALEQPYDDIGLDKFLSSSFSNIDAPLFLNKK